MTAPLLSVVVISYDMERELPRTLFTLSPRFQRDIKAEQYEVILVDNGSPHPVDLSTIRDAWPQLHFHRIDGASSSPVAAINAGLAMARGDIVGVMIDGARMASPRLLATALEACNLHSGAVVGTIAFHLGPDVQMRSVANGYDQAEEDRLLGTVDWQGDGYALFEISVLAGSSGDGWFVLPSETNALFLHRASWDQLGGYDAGFECPGGGLANLDTWARACALPDAKVFMLLGEATFHQVHGGIATNAPPKARWAEFHEEFARLRGRTYTRPAACPTFYGQIPAQAWPSVSSSRPPRS